MAAPSSTVWGSVVGSGTGQAKLGIYVSLTTSNTQVVREVQVWYWTRYAVSDSSNTFYYDCSQTVTSATTSKGSVTINHTSNTSWSTSNQTKLATYSATYTRGTSAKTYKIYAKLTGIDFVGVAATANTSFTIPALASYTITYNANGGSGAPSNQTKYYGKTLTLSSTKPTKSNATTTYTVTLNANGGNCSTTSLSSTKTTKYTFSKWNTNSGGTGTSYAAGASYTANAAATLYAIYTSSTSTTAVTLPTPIRDGYTFKGWGTSSTATSGSTGSYTPSASITLYAIWSPKVITVVYHKNDGGDDTTLQQSFTYGQSGNKFGYNTDGTLLWSQTGQFGSWDKTNYILLGWSSDSSATVAQYGVYAQVTDSWIASNCSGATNTIHLYGVWKLNGCTHIIMARYQNADGLFGQYNEVYRDVVFVGDVISWSFEENEEYKGSSISYNVQDINNQTKYVDIYRQQYSIIYTENDGYCAPLNTDYYYGASVYITKLRPSRSGYKFIGWCADKTGNGTIYTSGEVFDGTTGKNVTLYAIWEKVIRNIYLYDNGRLISTEFIEISEGFAFGKNGEVYATAFADNEDETDNKIYFGDAVSAKELTECLLVDYMLINKTVDDDIETTTILVDQNGNQLLYTMEDE